MYLITVLLLWRYRWAGGIRQHDKNQQAYKTAPDFRTIIIRITFEWQLQENLHSKKFETYEKRQNKGSVRNYTRQQETDLPSYGVPLSYIEYQSIPSWKCFTILWFLPVYQAERRTTIHKQAKTASLEMTTYNELPRYYTSKTFYNETVNQIGNFFMPVRKKGKTTAHVRISVTLRSVRATIVHVEKQWVLRLLCICSLNHQARNVLTPYCHLRPTPLYTTFPHYVINVTILRGFFQYKMRVLIFSTTSVWNISHSTKNWARYDQTPILAFM